MAKKRKRPTKKRQPSDVSYGLLELAARACGYSQLTIMEQLLGPEAAMRSARGHKALTDGPAPSSGGLRP